MAQRRREIAAAVAGDLALGERLRRHQLVGRHRGVALHEPHLVDADGVAEVADRAERARDLVGHRAAGVEHDVEDPALAPAARQHDVGALGAAPRRTGERALAGRDRLEPALQRELPRRAIDAAQRRDRLARRAGVGSAQPFGEAHRAGEAQAPWPRAPSSAPRSPPGRPLHRGRARPRACRRARRPPRRRRRPPGAPWSPRLPTRASWSAQRRSGASRARSPRPSGCARPACRARRRGSPARARCAGCR